MLHFFIQRTARQQWGIFFVGLFLLLSALVAAFTWYVFNDGLHDSVDDSRNLALTASAKLEAILEDENHLLEQLANSPAFRNFQTESCEKVQAALDSLKFDEFERLGLLDTTGKLVCSPTTLSRERALRTPQYAWFQVGLKAEGFAIGGAFRSNPTLRWSVPLTFPVRNESKKVIGLIALVLDLESLRRRIFINAALVKGFRGGISDENNLLLLHNDATMIGQKIDPSSQLFEPIGEDTYRVRGTDGVWRLCGGANPRGTTWRAFFCTPEDTALATARRDASLAALVAVAIFSLVALGIYIFSRINIRRDDSIVKRVGDLARLQDLLWSNIPEGLAFFDNQGVMVEANEQLGLMLQRPRKTFIGQKLNNFAVHPSEQARTSVLKTGFGRWTTAFMRPDGTTIDIETTIKRFTSENRDIFIGVFRDFTELKRAETELRKSEELLEQTGRIAGIGGWELESPTSNPVWTANTRRIHEVADDYLPTLATAIEFYPKETQRLIAKAVNDAFKFGIPYDMEIPFITAKGRSLWVRTLGKPVLEGGSVVRLVGSFQDVTERRLAERELEEQRAKAEMASNAKSSFLAIMSHELRTPLTGIMGMADLLSAETLAPQHQKLVDRLAKSGRVLLDLINDVLDFSKFEANKLTIDHVPFIPRDIFDSVRDLMTPLAAEKNLTLIFAVATEFSASMLGDPKRLRQVLMNLIGNAVKFTTQGRIIVNASAQNLTSGETVMCVRVADTGSGISPKDQANLFKPYAQGDSRLVGRAGGTGLGLAISRLLVEAMGGEITVSTQPGEGSTFTFTVKLHKDSTSALAQPIETRNAMARAQRSLRILLGEDNETSRYLVSEVMRRKSHTVDTATNGAEALTAAKTSDYDLILMDMQMPVMNGMDAVREIRKLNNANATIPIIALTADLIDENRDKYLTSGVDAIVGKPIDWSMLESEMNRLLDDPTDRNEQQVLEQNRTTMEQALPTLDFNALNELASFLGPDKLTNLLVTFKQNVASYRTDMQRHVEASDLKQAKRTAHALRGLSIQFGALRLGKAATDIENKFENIAQVKHMMPELDQLIASALTEIETLPKFGIVERV